MRRTGTNSFWAVGDCEQARSVRGRRDSALGVEADLEHFRTHFKAGGASGYALDAGCQRLAEGVAPGNAGRAPFLQNLDGKADGATSTIENGEEPQLFEFEILFRIDPALSRRPE